MLRSAVAIFGIIGLAAISHRLLRHYLTSSESQKPRASSSIKQGSSSNSNAFETLDLRKPILEEVMEALANPNTHSIGVSGSLNKIIYILLPRVYERVQREELFGTVVTTTVTKYPDVWKIQEDIARQLGFTFKNIYEDRRAEELIHMIKKENNILIVLCDLYKGLDLSMLGIPRGSDHHKGCKILLTSIAKDVLSKHMHTQINFTYG
ncbi:hypothetical protein K1719_001996 [Acacia pycnantha]|nr:hypothetical protein K1719_001996 [Acacia pycnantha]